MGSSPVTATILLLPMDLLDALETFFRDEAPLAPGEGVVVAFSGGPDSTALLWGMSRLAAERGLRLAAAHLDHAMDPGSGRPRRRRGPARRARWACRCRPERADGAAGRRRPGESAEAAGRRARYEFLERTRRGARRPLDRHRPPSGRPGRDRAAPPALRQRPRGAGGRPAGPWRGRAPAAGAARARRSWRRWRRRGSRRSTTRPTATSRVPRNRVRHRLLPALAPARSSRTSRAGSPGWPAGPAPPGRARSTGSARDGSPSGAVEGGIAVDRAALEALPAELLPFAFAWLHRQAGAPYPAGERGARGAAAPARGRPGGRPATAAAAGAGRRRGSCWSCAARRRCGSGSRISLILLRFRESWRSRRSPSGCASPRRAVEPWMFQGSPHRAGLALPLDGGRPRHDPQPPPGGPYPPSGRERQPAAERGPDRPPGAAARRGSGCRSSAWAGGSPGRRA